MALAGALLSSGVGGLSVVDNPRLFEMFFQITASGDYVTGGDTLDLTAVTGAPGLNLPMSTQLPIQVTITGKAGYVYQYVPGTTQANGKVKVLQSAGFTPSGTVAAPTITTTTNAGTTEPLYTNGGALTQTTGATGITGVQAPAFTGSAVAAAPLAEIAASSYPSGVTGDTIIARASFLRG